MLNLILVRLERAPIVTLTSPFEYRANMSSASMSRNSKTIITNITNTISL
jgi:hypothetical protein